MFLLSLLIAAKQSKKELVLFWLYLLVFGIIRLGLNISTKLLELLSYSFWNLILPYPHLILLFLTLSWIWMGLIMFHTTQAVVSFGSIILWLFILIAFWWSGWFFMIFFHEIIQKDPYYNSCYPYQPFYCSIIQVSQFVQCFHNQTYPFLPLLCK